MSDDDEESEYETDSEYEEEEEDAGSKVDLKKAWDYFHDVVLPHHVTEVNAFNQESLRKLEQGEPGGKHYDVWYTPLTEIGDFGVGIGLYFSSRIGMMFILIFMGTINFYTFLYYMGEDFQGPSTRTLTGADNGGNPSLESGGDIDPTRIFMPPAHHHRHDKNGVSIDVEGSAWCKNRENVCMDSHCIEKGIQLMCKLGLVSAFLEFFTTLIFFVYLAVMTGAQTSLTEDLDVAEQTAQDYSLMVEDPEPDNIDPEEWRIFFSRWGRVAYVSVAVSNGRLMELLSERRTALRALHVAEAEESQAKKARETIEKAQRRVEILEKMNRETSNTKQVGGMVKQSYEQVPGDKENGNLELEEKERFDRELVAMNVDGATWVMHEEELALQENAKRGSVGTMRLMLMQCGVARDPEFWRNRLRILDGQLEITKETIPGATKVFVTYEEEKSQRAALADLCVGELASAFNLANLPAESKFRYTNVLDVSEAPEPVEVKWRNLEKSFRDWSASLLLGWGGALIVTVLFTYIIYGMFASHSTWFAGFGIAIINTVLPDIMTALTNLECHITVIAREKSYMNKLVVSRWCVTALALYTYTKFEDTMTKSHTIESVRAILVADMVMRPCLQCADLKGRFDRYIRSRYVHSQELLLKLFKGTGWLLSERYTNMSTSVFVAMFWANVYPLSYIMCALTMFITYLADKYCLFRIWRPLKNTEGAGVGIGDAITTLHRRHIALCILIHFIVNLHFYASWPMSNVCPTKHHLEGFADGENMNITNITAVQDLLHMHVDDKTDDHITNFDNIDFSSDAIKMLMFQLFNVTNTVVFRHCDQQHNGFIHDVKVHNFMTQDQKAIVITYRIAAICALAVLSYAYFAMDAFDWGYSLFYGRYESRGAASETKFSDVEGIEAYIPQVYTDDMPVPLMAVDLDTIDERHISWVGLHAAYNLNSEIDLPGLSEADRDRFFCRCQVYYPDDPDPTMTYQEYLQTFQPALWQQVKDVANDPNNPANTLNPFD